MKRALDRVVADLRRLRSDESGALMILFIAAILLLVAMIWVIIGTGQRVVQKELIQSSADTAAFSAAVIKAKGLNVIAFCNLIMALLLAIIMLLRLVKAALQVLIGLCAAACFATFFSFGATAALCALEPEVVYIYNQYTQILDQIEPRIMDAMRGMAKVERGVAKVFPALSLVEAVRVGTHSHYQHNFSNGTLLTVSFPLPLGDDLSLPVEDGTWDQLCTEARKSIGRLVTALIDATGLPGFVGDLLGGAVSSLLEPLQGILCGSGGTSTQHITSYEKRYACNQCEGAEKSNWNADQIVRDADGNVVSTIPGQFCNIDGFSSLICSNPNIVVTCTDGKEYTNLSMTECLVKKDVTESLGTAIDNKPLPLVLKSDADAHLIVRAYTLLTNSSMESRRHGVALAALNKGGNPALNQLFSSAQAQVYPHNGHHDLWHMNWRARLVRFSFSNETNGSAGGTSGGPDQSQIDKIFGALQNFLTNDIGAALADQFLLH